MAHEKGNGQTLRCRILPMLGCRTLRQAKGKIWKQHDVAMTGNWSDKLHQTGLIEFVGSLCSCW